MQIQLIITFEPGKPIHVSGPLQDKLLCMGMVELAKQAILTHEPSPIVQPNVMPDIKLVS